MGSIVSHIHDLIEEFGSWENYEKHHQADDMKTIKIEPNDSAGKNLMTKNDQYKGRWIGTNSFIYGDLLTTSDGKHFIVTSEFDSKKGGSVHKHYEVYPGTVQRVEKKNQSTPIIKQLKE
ncbi:hypothetical protein LZD49_07250 [Dyadobacter sp. CY261]|uniref:hypothetical protein n=1 Tax=Dyadobacter sp. CY261 TaxID=2907203 RepID=UPI001F3D5755|nr:hypothetical protein [Dyadobacter sp. CY261]MCF0070262.1 hypothetical protein [Dyadobacter sp. CY261]